MIERLLAFVLVVVVGTACASAPRTRSFQDIPNYLDTGTTIRLTEATGLMTTGRLQTLSPTSLTILSGGNPREVPESHVAKIQRPERWVGRAALIGLGVGFGVGLIAARSSEPSGTPVDTQAGAGIGAAGMLLGTAAGAIFGAVVKITRTVYLAPLPTAPGSQDRQSVDVDQESAWPRGWSDGHVVSHDPGRPAPARDDR